MTKYPEHERLKVVQQLSQTVGPFLEWLAQDLGYVIVKRRDGKPACVSYRTETLLAQFFSIDPKVIAAEKKQMQEDSQ
jgi:hypothetical protein